MPDLEELLDRAVPPHDVNPPVDRIVRRARRRTAAQVLGLVALVAVATTTALTTAGGTDRPEPPVIAPVPSPTGSDADLPTRRPVVRQVGGDLELTMQPGTDGPAAQAHADGLGASVDAGTAEVVTWIESDLGRVEVITFEGSPPGRSFSTDCLAVRDPFTSQPPDCGPDALDRLNRVGLVGYGGGIDCDLVVQGVYGGPDAHEFVVTTQSGPTVSIVAWKGLAYVIYPGLWGRPLTVDSYDADGNAIASLGTGRDLRDHPCGSGLAGWASDSEVSHHGFETTELDRVEQAGWQADHRTLRLTLSGAMPPATLTVRVVLDDEWGPVDGNFLVRLDVASTDDPDRILRFETRDADDCKFNLSTVGPDAIEGWIDCLLPGDGPTVNDIAARLDLANDGS